MNPNPVCIGDTITFTLSGVVDNGGQKRKNCNVVPDGPVTPTYTWTLTIPPGYPTPLPPLSGSGPVVSIEAKVGGTYSATFIATADRECDPPSITIGPATATVPSDYDTVSIEYKTFIAPQAIKTSSFAFWLWSHYKGDGRWFGGGTSRTSQSTSVTVDPGVTKGQVGAPAQGFGTTVGYDNDPEFEDVFMCEFCPVDFSDYDDWCLAVGASAGCTATSVAGQNGNVLSVQHSRVDNEVVQVQFDIVGKNPCAFAVPAIDAHFTLSFRQKCLSGVLQPMEFMLTGTHDGFPWHELTINGIRVYEHDPCCTQETPNSLSDLIGNWNYRLSDPSDLCHTPLTSESLQNWQPVPGLEP